MGPRALALLALAIVLGLALGIVPRAHAGLAGAWIGLVLAVGAVWEEFGGDWTDNPPGP